MVKLGNDFIFQIFGLCEEAEEAEEAEETEAHQTSDSDEDADADSVSEDGMLADDFNNIKNNSIAWFKGFLQITHREYHHGDDSTNLLLDFLDKIEDIIHEIQPRIKRARKTLQGRQEVDDEEGDDENDEEMEEAVPEETMEEVDDS